MKVKSVADRDEDHVKLRSNTPCTSDAGEPVSQQIASILRNIPLLVGLTA
ncbi:MAG: hypothetical protein AABY83_04590 [Pseudomonadota bacterium]